MFDNSPVRNTNSKTSSNDRPRKEDTKKSQNSNFDASGSQKVFNESLMMHMIPLGGGLGSSSENVQVDQQS